MKNKLQEVYNDYKQDFLKYKDIVGSLIKEKYHNFQYWLNENPARKKYVAISGLALFVLVLIINLYSSFAYYNNLEGHPIVHAKVGDMYINDYDYVLLVYLEDIDSTGAGNGNYRLASNIPASGYNYSGYNCKNNSTLIYNEATQTTSVTTTQKEVCSIFFDLASNLDITLKVMLEDEVDSNNYVVGENIPAYGYTYDHYDCANDSALVYDSQLHSASVSTGSKEYCSMYFNKESADIEVNIYTEETYNGANYIRRTTIPSNINYVLNTDRSSCKNRSGTAVPTDITYSNGYINVGTGEVSSCDVYLNRTNE